MKKALFLLLSLSLIISLPIFAEDMPADPMADASVQGDVTVDGSISAADLQTQPDNTAMPGEAPQDPLAGANISAGDAGVSAGLSSGSNADGTAPQDPGDPGALMPDMSADVSLNAGISGTAPQTQDNGISVQGGADMQGMDMQDMNQMPGDNSPQPQVQPQANQPGPETVTAKKSAPIRAGLPKYKAVPYTNDLRVMDKNTGELGQVNTLRRVMDWSVKASSSMANKNHNPADTRDLNAYTAWVENKDGYGEGESLTLHMEPIYFSAIQEGEVNSVTCTGLKIINGYNKSHEDWFNNSRVKIMKIYQNKKPFCLIELYDSTNWQDITFKKPMKIKPDDVIKAEIVEVFEGYKYPNAAITEFLLVGHPAGQIVGYDQMNGQTMTNVRNGGMYFK